MLEAVKFKFGSAPGQPPLEIQTGPSVTVFVGPNNSGKSHALRELSTMFHDDGGTVRPTDILASINFKEMSEQEAEEELARATVAASPGETAYDSHVFIQPSYYTRHQVQPHIYAQSLMKPNDPNYRNNFRNYYAFATLLSMDGPSRVTLTNAQPRGDLKHPQGPFARLEVLSKLNATGQTFKTAGGIELLQAEDKETARNLLRDLEGYGLFVVPIGEVEAWLKDLDVDRGKQKWLRSIFEVMGSDPNTENYVKPAEGDVWDFMGKISQWSQDRMRRGIPL